MERVTDQALWQSSSAGVGAGVRAQNAGTAGEQIWTGLGALLIGRLHEAEAWDVVIFHLSLHLLVVLLLFHLLCLILILLELFLDESWMERVLLLDVSEEMGESHDPTEYLLTRSVKYALRQALFP